MAKDFNMCVLLDIYGALISEKQFEVMDYYYNQDYSLAEISEHLNITRQGVRDSIKRAEQVLLECEDKLKLTKKEEQLRIKTEKINNLIIKIKELNNLEIKNNSLAAFTDELANEVENLQL